MDHTTPVAVLSSIHHGALGIVRSLGRLNVPVYGVDSDPWAPAFSSRYCQGKVILNFENGSAGMAVSRLLEFGRKLGGNPILIPTTDPGAIWVSDHAEDLRQVFRFPRQDLGLVHSLCDKSRMQQLAARCGVATAGSLVPQSREDVLRYLETATFPVMLKAIDDAKLRRVLGSTKFLVRNRRALLELYDRLNDGGAPSLMLQDYIPGEDWMFNGYFNEDSECLFGITGKKVRRFPVNTGVTSLGICLRNEAVEKTTRKFMKAIGYRGILDIGYRYDYRNGQYRVLDVNPRIGCTFRLFVGDNGMDVVRALYLDLTGQPVVAAPAREGRKWLVEDFDLISSVQYWRDGNLTLNGWVRSLNGVRETACFALDDPLPLLPKCVTDFFELYRWLNRRMRARIKRKPALRTPEHASNGVEPATVERPVSTK
jgi:D-aspartate ligase